VVRPKARARAFSPYDPRQTRGRLFIAVAAAIITYFAMFGSGWAVRVVAAWDALAITLLGLGWWIIGTATAKLTRHRASSEDPGRTAVWAMVLVSSTFSVFAGAYVLRAARTLAPGESGVLAGLCLVAVIASWALTHTSYTFRYAHLYYRDIDPEGGLEFPGGEAPDDLDFAYYAFTVGMCFQVSDVTASSKPVRRTTLGHALLSFAYNTAILSLALNLLFGFLA
jgi:uncharacterized membrane protein